jgi:hypothetical protein
MTLDELDRLLSLRWPQTETRFGLSTAELDAMSLTPAWADWLKANLPQVERESRWQEMGLPDDWNHTGWANDKK